MSRDFNRKLGRPSTGPQYPCGSHTSSLHFLHIVYFPANMPTRKLTWCSVTWLHFQHQTCSTLSHSAGLSM